MIICKFNGFEHKRIELEDVTVETFIKGAGPPLLLLHGYPQTHATWEKVVPILVNEFQCVIVDLPGYGKSKFTSANACRQNSSKRSVAAILVQVMNKLGYSYFNVLGHDRGGRVAYRMALDHPNIVKKLGLIEIIPTSDMWSKFNAELALKAYHWTFLAQPYPLPEKILALHSIEYFEWTLKNWTKSNSLSPFSKSALISYRSQFRDTNCVHAMCEDYRAGATIDRHLDEIDLRNGVKIQCPLHFVWSSNGFAAQNGNPLSLWRKWSSELTGNQINSGHFPQEENPKALLDSFVPFFTD